MGVEKQIINNNQKISSVPDKNKCYEDYGKS